MHKLVTLTAAGALCAAGPLAFATQPAQAATASTNALLVHAMDTEAFSYAQYNAFADNAGSDHVAADTWRTVADVEYYDHFVTEGKMTGLVGSNSADLRKAVAAEDQAMDNYAAWAKVARAEGCTKVADTFLEIRKDEVDHHALFIAALNRLQAGKPAPAGPDVTTVKVIAGRPSCNKPRTMKALDAAMHSESMSWGQYDQWAEQAANTGKPQLAALFTSIGDVELKDHFATEANLAGMVKPTVKANLATSVAAEVDANQMYSRDITIARSRRQYSVANTLTQIRGDERGHLTSFRTLLAR